MALPKIMHAQFDILVPSLKEKRKFRQFLVKEEKILLTAKASADSEDILTAIKQVVQNCAMDENFNANNIAIFDLEYIFLKLRGLSINNIVKLSYRDFEDDQVYDFEVDLDKVELTPSVDNTSTKIAINDTSGIVLRYPSASLYSDKEFLKSTPEDGTIILISKCIDQIYDEETVYDSKTVSKDEMRDFIDNLDVNTFEKINEFLTTVPKLKHVIEYKNSLGNDRTVELDSLNDFFMLR